MFRDQESSFVPLGSIPCAADIRRPMNGLMFHGFLQKRNEINHLSACETAYDAVIPGLGIERIHGEIEKHGFIFSILPIAVPLKCANANSEIVDVYIDCLLWRSRESAFHASCHRRPLPRPIASPSLATCPFAEVQSTSRLSLLGPFVSSA